MGRIGFCVGLLTTAAVAGLSPAHAQMTMPTLPQFRLPAPPGAPQYQPQQQPVAGTPPEMTPQLGDGFATAEEVTGAIGSALGNVTCPQFHDVPTAAAQWGARSLRITLANAGNGYRQPGVTNALLQKGLAQAWAACPIVNLGPNGERSYNYGVGAIEIYGPSENGGEPQLLVQAQNFSPDGQWGSVVDIEQQREQAIAQAQAAAAPQTAVPQLPPSVVAQPQAPAVEDVGAGPAPSSDGRWWLILLGAAVLAGLVLLRERILRWYFFYFHPHPAEPMVRRALQTDWPAAGNAAALAAALGDTPAGGATFRKVRLEQAERLYRDLHTASVARQAEITRQAERLAEAARADAAYVSIQEAAALAASSLERAKAAARRSRSFTEDGRS